METRRLNKKKEANRSLRQILIGFQIPFLITRSIGMLERKYYYIAMFCVGTCS